MAAASPAPVATASPTSRAGHPGLSSFRSVRRHRPVALPVRLRIPALDVTSGLETLDRAPDLTVEVPRNPDSAGWYAGGPRPGQKGPAVILGHLDSARGPAVFARLPTLRPGDVVLVDRADGTTARFAVQRLERHRKDRFPSDAVYFPTLRPELRLVTCGGTIDPVTGHYRDNVIVFAEAA
ncbi:MAG: class F sortase [Actinomycetota bacterium]|nr:class F sortase [Actinomycetota bacterium]